MAPSTNTGKTAAKKAAPNSGSSNHKAAETAAATAAGSKSGAKKAGGSAKATKKSAVPKSPFSAKFLTQQHEALISERATYLRQAESLKAEADSLVEDFEPGDVQFDEESGEGDTLNIERERDLALSAQARHAVEEIDHALAKFEVGTYGICEISGDPIPTERLEAIPWAREQVGYKTGGFGRR